MQEELGWTRSSLRKRVRHLVENGFPAHDDDPHVPVPNNRPRSLKTLLLSRFSGTSPDCVFGFDGFETHVLALHRPGDCFRIAVVVLVRLHKSRTNCAGSIAQLRDFFPEPGWLREPLHAQQESSAQTSARLNPIAQLPGRVGIPKLLIGINVQVVLSDLVKFQCPKNRI